MKKVQQPNNEDHFNSKNISHSRRKHEELSYHFSQSFNQNEILVLEVKSGEFTLFLKVLNIDRNNPLGTVKPTTSGAFGAVHMLSFRGEKIVLKAIEYGKEIEVEKKSI